MENFKHYTILKRIAIASTVFQVATLFILWFFRIRGVTGPLLLISGMLYFGIIVYILYVAGNFGKILFKKPWPATVSILFSLPVVFGMFVAGRIYNQKHYEVSVFNRNGKSYKEIKGYYNTGELYAVEYWYAPDKIEFDNITNFTGPGSEENQAKFIHFATEENNDPNLVKDSIWITFEKSGDTINTAVYKDGAIQSR